MHESIAKAAYKGGMKRAEENTSAFFERMNRNPPKMGRRPWLRWVTEVIASDPSMVLLDWGTAGGKIKAVEIFITTLGRSPTDRWEVMAWRITPRKFNVAHYVVPLDITRHVIERVMQREDVHDVMEAMQFLAPAVVSASILLNHTADEILVPCRSGAVATKRDTRVQSGRVLTTYLSSDQLKPNQRVELESIRDVAEKAIANARANFK